MNKTTTSLSKLNPDQRRKAIDLIINFFAEDRDEEIGMIAGEEVLDFFLDNIGDEIYNRAIYDAKDKMKARCNELDIDLDLLIKR